MIEVAVSVPRGREREVVSVTLSGVQVSLGSVEVTKTVLAGRIEVCVK